MLLRFLACIVLASSPATAFEPSGTWTVATALGPATLVLEVDGETVTGRLVSPHGECVVTGALLVDDEDESSIEGTWQCDAGGAEFEFYFDEEAGYELLVIPVDGEGTPHGDLAEFWAAERGPAVDGGPGETGLVGIWSTQVIMNSPEGSIATELFMEIRADGTIRDLGSRAVGGGAAWSGDTGLLGAGESAHWRTSGNVLEVSSQGSPWVPLARFDLQGNRLGLAWYDGTHSIWHRKQP